MPQSLVVAAVALGLASAATAQLTWTSLGPIAPSPRSAAGCAYMFDGQRVLLFGGLDASGPLGDTWQLDAAGWTQLAPAVAPPPRSHAMMAFSENILPPTIVMLGGRGANGAALTDAWRWTPAAGWTPITAVPAARESATLVRRAYEQGFILFGGRDGALTYADTWLYTIGFVSSWTYVPVTNGPSGRYGHAMTTVDATTRLMFGGVDAAGNYLDDTWLFDDSTTPPSWTQLNPAVKPPPRFGHALRLAGHRQRVQLFGGAGPNGFLNDTWEWDGASWVPIVTAGSPPPRAEAALVDGAHMQNMAPWEGLLIGGRDFAGPVADAWQVTSTVPATLTPFGVQPPFPFYLGGDGGWVGGSLRARVLIPGNTPMLPFLIVGFSSTTSSLGPLPINLGPVFNNTPLLVDPLALLTLVGIFPAEIPIPPSPTLIGAHVYLQALDYGMLGPTWTGWGLSRGLDCQLGWR